MSVAASVKAAESVSSLVETLCAVATGASFTGVTLIDTIAGVESRLPSFALNVKLSAPL